MIRGTTKNRVNRIVNAPVRASEDLKRRLTNRVYPLRVPLPPNEEPGWKYHPIFGGLTADVQSLSCHASVLSPGRCPHPPHTHKEEEILLLLQGEVDLILPDREHGDRRERLRPGQFVYYPVGFAHTLETVSDDSANYLMFKWHGDETRHGSRLSFARFDISDCTETTQVTSGYCPRLIFEGATNYLRKLHCHFTTLTPKAGYEPHIDAYDVAIVVLEGEVETLGERVGPHGIIFYAAGEPHGMNNPGITVAKYLVFEFHGSRTSLSDGSPEPSRSLLSKVADPQCWKRALAQSVKRLRHIK